jgi:hypothetical protein
MGGDKVANEEINNSEEEEINSDAQEEGNEEKEEEEEEARLEQEEEALFPFHQEIFDWDWGAEYQKCPKFVEIWRRCHTPNAEWPEGIKIFKDKLYHFEKLCIPWGLQRSYIREQHGFVGHVGADRLWYQFQPTTEFAMEKLAKRFTYKVMTQCETCQATQRAHRLGGPMEATPIPPG